jgi:periplasmic divalent cation tolerance protein
VKKPARKPPAPAPGSGADARVLVVVSTVGTEEQALEIAHALVARHLAACVNIVPRIRSVFSWKGKVSVDEEWLLFVKSAPGNFEKVKEAIRKLHAYELPEILGFPAIHADPLFAKWVCDASTQRRPRTVGKKKKKGATKGAKRRSGR